MFLHVACALQPIHVRLIAFHACAARTHIANPSECIQHPATQSGTACSWYAGDYTY